MGIIQRLRLIRYRTFYKSRNDKPCWCQIIATLLAIRQARVIRLSREPHWRLQFQAARPVRKKKIIKDTGDNEVSKAENR